MAKVKIKTTKKSRAGRTISIRNDVQLSFDQNLEAEIDEKDLAKVIDVDDSLYMEDGADKSTDDDTDADGDGESEGDTEKADGTEGTDAETDDSGEKGEEADSGEFSKAELMKMNKDDIRELAEGAGIPKEEWDDLNKEPLVDFLVEKLN